MPNSVTPILRGLEPYEYHLAVNQPEYEPLHVLRGKGPTYSMVSRWTFTKEERAAIAAGADILVTQLTFGSLFQPTCVQAIIGDSVMNSELESIIEEFGLNSELDERLENI